MPRRSASLHIGSPSVVESEHSSIRAEQSNGYPVHKESGTGKKIVRRRVPPPPISPILEGFLASAPAELNSKSVGLTLASDKRPTLAIKTTSPLTELDDGSTARTLTPKPRFDPMRSFRNSFRSRQTENHDPSASERKWKGKEKAIVMDEAGETRESKIAAKAREIRAWMMGKSGSEIHTSTTYPDYRRDKAETSYAARTRKSVGGLFKNRSHGVSRVDRGPKPGQTYEIVNRQIVENSPEKTVEISTWREHTPKRVKDDEEKMSIYYVSADEYPLEGGFAYEAGPTVELRTEGLMESPPETVASNARTTSLPSPSHQAEFNSPREDRNQYKSAQTQTSTSRDGTISPSTSEKDPDPDRPEVKANGRDLGRRTSYSHQDTSRRGDHYKESTPSEKIPQPKSPIRSPRSDSTTSSTKSAATLEFEAILTSCEPSLLHVSPILESLGIRRVEHLKAIARLTPNTRDREVKEHALRLGMTVMDWAILLDKIFTLYS